MKSEKKKGKNKTKSDSHTENKWVIARMDGVRDGEIVEGNSEV